MPPRRRSRGKGATRQTKKGGVEKREAIKSRKVVVADEVGVDVKEHGKQRGVGQREAEPLPPGPSSPPKYNPTSSELEKKRLQVADELRKVEQQVSRRSAFLQLCCDAAMMSTFIGRRSMIWKLNIWSPRVLLGMLFGVCFNILQGRYASSIFI